MKNCKKDHQAGEEEESEGKATQIIALHANRDCPSMFFLSDCETEHPASPSSHARGQNCGLSHNF